MKNFFLLFLIPFLLNAEEIKFTYTDNSDNESGFELCEVEEIQGNTRMVQVLATNEKNEVSFQLELSKVSDRKVAVRAYNEFGFSGFSNVVEVGNKPQNPKNLTITINVQIL